MTEESTKETTSEIQPSLLAKTALILIVLAILVITWQWLSTRQRFNEVERALSEKLETYQATNQQSLTLAKQADENSAQANKRSEILAGKLAESRDQQEVLQTLYNQLAENREATAVAEVEQFITIAIQQLQLAGNVKAALLALQAADKHLEPLNLPRAIQLRETLKQDIENLRKLPQIDIISMSSQLERIADLCSALPLISERQPTLNANATEQKTTIISPQNALQKFGTSVWLDIKNLVTVERIDKPEPPLLSADHAFYLRENVKLRLLTARIALLQHDEATFTADLKSVNTWLNLYFDNKHPNATEALSLLKKLSANNVGIEPPLPTESLAAVSRYKLSLEQSAN